MSTRDRAFSLAKWYIDCAGDDGRTAIGYWASLAWLGISLTWQAITVYETGCEAIQCSSLAGGPAPAREGDRIVWRPHALGCTFAADIRRPPLALRLFESEAGVIDWRCDAPAAFVKVELANRPSINGTGYAEQLTLTIPPWRLPIREVRWGRWMDPTADHSVVWIDWSGTAPCTHVFVDGARAPGFSVNDVRISSPTTALTLEALSTLSGLAVADIILGIPALRAVVPSSILAFRETKWSSLGTLRRPGAPRIQGRAIHERLVFR
ncbi:MAG TPA: hypothetical protein VFO14_24505 [Vicinamibacterales bacterium]|nr:hypothetical protein [Vicinamibacterales bacterium]